MMIDNCLLVIIYRRGHILEFSVTAESISRSQDCLSVKSCVDTVICNLKLRENAILTFALIRNIWIKTRESRLKKLICVKILTCQKWNLGEILTSHDHPPDSDIWGMLRRYVCCSWWWWYVDKVDGGLNNKTYNRCFTLFGKCQFVPIWYFISKCVIFWWSVLNLIKLSSSWSRLS